MRELEKSADQLDIASQLQEQLNENALATVRAAGRPQTHPDFDGTHCLDCEDDMPEVRLQMQRIRCASCEGELEKKAKLQGR